MSSPKLRALFLAALMLGGAGRAGALVATADTFVDSKLDSINFGSDPVAFVGRGFFVIVPFIDRALLQFTLPTLVPGTHVAHARLRIFIDFTSTDPFSLGIGAALLDSPFVENTVTWNTQPGILASPITTANMTTLAGEWFEMDVTALVLAVLQSGSPSAFFLRLAALDESINTDKDFSFRTKEFGTGAFAPQLILAFSATTAPTLSPSAIVGLAVILLSLGLLAVQRVTRRSPPPRQR